MSSKRIFFISEKVYGQLHIAIMANTVAQTEEDIENKLMHDYCCVAL